MNKTKILIGIITTILISLGYIFRVNHWPGGIIFLLIGFIILLALYLPVIFIDRIKETNNQLKKVSLILGLIASLILFLGIVFRIFFWPGGAMIHMIGVFTFSLMAYPLFAISCLRENKSEIKDSIFISIVIIGIVSITQIDKNHEVLNDSLKMEKTDIDRLLIDLETTHHNYDKISSIVQKKDSLNDLINTLKISFLKYSGQGGEAITDTIYNENQSMILTLKYEIRKYQDFLLTTVDNERLQDKIRDALNTETNMENTSWEENHFKHLPMSGLITVLTGLQININSVSDDAIYYLKEFDNIE